MRCEARRVAPEDFGRRVGTLLKRDGRVSFLLRSYCRLRLGSTFTVCVIVTGCRPQNSL
jgi:hypothetical protein